MATEPRVSLKGRVLAEIVAANPDGRLKAVEYDQSGSVCRVEWHGEEPQTEPDEVAQDRLYVNEERTVFVRIWADGTVEVARRDDPSHTWGPPVYLKEETPA